MKTNFTKYIIIIALLYGIFGSIYILLENQDILNVKKTAGATFHDQNDFHIPQINYFLKHKFSLTNFPSSTATTPGQHLFYAAILKLLNVKHITKYNLTIRFIHLFFNLLVIFWVGLLFYDLEDHPRLHWHEGLPT